MNPPEAAPRLVSIHVYPLKSAGGIALSRTRVDEAGLEHDRRWMLLGESGQFISQRTHPRMALLRVALDEDALRVTAPGLCPLVLPLSEPNGAARLPPVRVWHSDRSPADCGAGAAEWASTFLGVRCRVVRAVTPKDGKRLSDLGFVRSGFADAEPALLVSGASLADLNARLAEPLPMNRFRPNLVVEGVGAFAEDSWGAVRIGGAGARVVRPCPRCVTTTVDQETGVKGDEPLRTLATYRRMENGQVAFGMNVGFEGEGVFSVGDAVLT